MQQLVAECSTAIAAKIEARNVASHGFFWPISVTRACRYARTRAGRIALLRTALPEQDHWMDEHEPGFGRWLKVTAETVKAVDPAPVAHTRPDAESPPPQQSPTPSPSAVVAKKKKEKKARTKPGSVPAVASPSPARTPAQRLCDLIAALEAQLTTCAITGNAAAVGKRCSLLAQLSGAYAALSLCPRFDVSKTTERAKAHINLMVTYSRQHKRPARTSLALVCDALAFSKDVQRRFPGATGRDLPIVALPYLVELTSLVLDALDVLGVKAQPFVVPPEAVRFVSLAIDGPDMPPAEWTTLQDAIQGVALHENSQLCLNRLADLLGQKFMDGKVPATCGLYRECARLCFDRALQAVRADPESSAYTLARAQIERDAGVVGLLCRHDSTAGTTEAKVTASRLLRNALSLFRFEHDNLHAGRLAYQCACAADAPAGNRCGGCSCLQDKQEPFRTVGGQLPEDQIPLDIKNQLIRLMATFSGFYLTVALYLAYRACLASPEISRKWLDSLCAVLLPCLARVGAEFGGAALPGEQLMPATCLDKKKDRAVIFDMELNRMAFAGMCNLFVEPAAVDAVLDDAGFFVGPGDWVPLAAVLKASNGAGCIVRLHHVYRDTFTQYIAACLKSNKPCQSSEEALYISHLISRERIICGTQDWGKKPARGS